MNNSKKVTNDELSAKNFSVKRKNNPGENNSEPRIQIIKEVSPTDFGLSTMDKFDNLNMSAQFLEIQRQRDKWHQEAIAFEEVIEHQKAEIRGLQESKGGMKEIASDFLLTILHATGEIDAAIKNIMPPKYGFKVTKYIMYTIIGLAFIGYLWFNPTVMENFQMMLAIPGTQLVILMVFIVAIIGIYYWKIARR